MKLIQLNTWFGRLEKQIPILLKQERPDIICLQEAITYSGKAHGGFFLTLEDIRQMGEWPSIFSSPLVQFSFMRGTASFGNAIASKYPFLEQQTIFTNLELVKDFDFDTSDYNVRNLQHAVIDIDGKCVNVLNHHGHHVPEHKNGNQETLRQTKLIADYVQSLNGPVILTGDFNLAPHSKSLEQINSVLDNLSTANNLRTTRTQLTHKTEICDYIFVNESVKVHSFNASDEIVSDHKALILEFDI